MNREDFVNHYINSLKMYEDRLYAITLNREMIGSIYDLQQQIAQKDEFIDYLDKRLIDLEREVYNK